jgi:hypothetical protein
MSTSIKVETILDDGSMEVCTATYTSFARNVTGTDIHACGGGGRSDYSELNIDALIGILQIMKKPAP